MSDGVGQVMFLLCRDIRTVVVLYRSIECGDLDSMYEFGKRDRGQSRRDDENSRSLAQCSVATYEDGTSSVRG